MPCGSSTCCHRAGPGPESEGRGLSGDTEEASRRGCGDRSACTPSEGSLIIARWTGSSIAKTPTVRSIQVSAFSGESSGRLQDALCRPPDPRCTASTLFHPRAVTWGPCRPGSWPQALCSGCTRGSSPETGWGERGWGPPCWGLCPPQDPAAPSPPCPAGQGWKQLPSGSSLGLLPPVWTLPKEPLLSRASPLNLWVCVLQDRDDGAVD